MEVSSVVFATPTYLLSYGHSALTFLPSAHVLDFKDNSQSTGVQGMSNVKLICLFHFLITMFGIISGKQAESIRSGK